MAEPHSGAAAGSDESLRAAESRIYETYGLRTREHRVTVSGCRVRVAEVDGEGPPVVLLHGISSVTALAIPLIPAFGGRRVLAIDFPGHGLSDPFAFEPARAAHALAEVVSAVVDEFAEGVVDLVAHSLGGQTALAYALAHPGAVRRLVLLGAPGAAFEGVRPVAAMRAFAVPGVGRLLLSLPTTLETYAKNGEAMLGPRALDGYPSEITEVGWLASRRAGFAASLASCFRALISLRGVRPGVAIPRERLAGIDAPTLMIWGDRDVFLTPAVGRASIDAIPGSRLIVVPGAGHAPWLDDLEGAGTAIAQFLHAEAA